MACVLKYTNNTVDDILEFGKCVKENGTSFELLKDSKKISVKDTYTDGVLIEDVGYDDVLSDSIFFKGWYGVEEANGYQFRWARSLAYINLSGLNGYNFRFIISTNNPLSTSLPISIYFINYNTKDRLGLITLTSEESSKPISINIDTDDFVIMLCADIGWIPAIYDLSSDDWRELGFAVEQVRLRKNADN